MAQNSDKDGWEDQGEDHSGFAKKEANACPYLRIYWSILMIRAPGVAAGGSGIIDNIHGPEIL